MGAIALMAIAPFVCIIQESPGLSIRPQIRLYMGDGGCPKGANVKYEELLEKYQALLIENDNL